MRIKINKVDQLFSKYVRLKAKNHCEYCGKYKEFGQLQTSHFWGRRNKSVRYDEENIAVLCFICHQRLGSNPEEHRAWFYKRLGDKRYRLLMLRANIPNRPDYKLIEMFLVAEIKKLE